MAYTGVKVFPRSSALNKKIKLKRKVIQMDRNMQIMRQSIGTGQPQGVESLPEPAPTPAPVVPPPSPTKKFLAGPDQEKEMLKRSLSEVVGAMSKSAKKAVSPEVKRFLGIPDEE